MDRTDILRAFRSALLAITTPRFYQTERGYQGALLAQLEPLLGGALARNGAVIEQEYQKTVRKQGLTIRPDIVIHQPFDPSRHTSRRAGNIAVIELKVKASAAAAESAYASLGRAILALEYPLGILVNVASSRSHYNLAPSGLAGRIVSFAVTLRAGHVQIVESGTF
jgi:hypothetical protein